MSATGLEVFDRTVQATNIWLNEIMQDLGPDRHFAWHVLGAVIRNLRDQLQADMAMHLGSQLPILIRGVYYDGWQTNAALSKGHSADDFLERVAASLASTRPVSPNDAVHAVFGVISRHLDKEQVRKTRATLSGSVRKLWPEALLLEGSRVGGPGSGEREERIRARAYQIWLEEGCPGERADDHWRRAEADVSAEVASGGSKPKAAEQTPSRRSPGSRRGGRAGISTSEDAAPSAAA